MTTDTSTIAYPGPAEVDEWLESIWDLVNATPCAAEVLPDAGFTHQMSMYHLSNAYVRFEPEGMAPFYGYWQPALSAPAPLVVHVPGYGAEISAHPEITADGYNVLHISPLGYCTPGGPDLPKQRNGEWPVLPDTILTDGQEGYRHWLANCAMAVNWAMARAETLGGRVSFFGTSQGGGGSLLLGSLFAGRGARCVCSDVPYLTDFRGAIASGKLGGYSMFADMLPSAPDEAAAWRTAGLIDTTSHVHRLDLPVLLTAGGPDETCPPHTIEKLFSLLPGTRSYTFLKDVGHRYTTEFIPLVQAWLKLYA